MSTKPTPDTIFELALAAKEAHDDLISSQGDDSASFRVYLEDVSVEVTRMPRCLHCTNTATEEGQLCYPHWLTTQPQFVTNQEVRNGS